jgi:hypothetical protein
LGGESKSLWLRAARRQIDPQSTGDQMGFRG